MKRPSGIITLTTDFGHCGPFVGIMKGVILSWLPDARIIDLSHEIRAHWPAEAGFWLARSWHYFPLGSVHVAIVDPGVGTARDIVVAQTGGHIFIAPDNGLLQPVVTGQGSTIHRLSPKWLENQAWPRSGSTFHGRDIFAPLAAAIAGNKVQPREVGPPVSSLVSCEIEPPRDQGNSLFGAVISVDHFGNLITNIDGSLLNKFRTPVVYAGGRTFQLYPTYGSRARGEFVALINSFCVVEIACVEASAAASLGIERGEPVVIQESNEE